MRSITRRSFMAMGLAAGLPFCSNGGGGLGQSVAAISKLAPAAHVGRGLSIYYSGGSGMPGQVKDWIDSQKLQG